MFWIIVFSMPTQNEFCWASCKTQRHQFTLRHFLMYIVYYTHPTTTATLIYFLWQTTRLFYHTCINSLFQTDLHIAHCLLECFMQMLAASKRTKMIKSHFLYVICSELKHSLCIYFFITFNLETKILFTKSFMKDFWVSGLK